MGTDDKITSAELINKQLEIRIQQDRDKAIAQFVESIAKIARAQRCYMIEVGGVKLTMAADLPQDYQKSPIELAEEDEDLLYHSAP